MHSSAETIKTPIGPLAGYRAGPGVFDEAHAADATLRPSFRRFNDALSQLTVSELKHRSDTCRRLVGEQGITYNVYGDIQSAERPWQLDPIPLVIAPDEWRSLEAALIQRATLINRILADCYGPQELIRSKWLPPALVFAQPDFLRPCHGIRAPQNTFLHFYACDLARSPDGRWWVVSDRTQIPTGTGYALANRLVTSRLFPDAFRDCQVHRLARFFRDVQQALSSLGKHKTDNPRIVMLTPGPYNETYFEQAYLARYLGYSLVEGQDLTVRDNRVFLKTLSGLEPVDVIVRRVDDDFCDPLELRNDSMLGVPGLVEALRVGNVAVANALGSGLLQSPAFLAFLPGLCRHILGEELKLPSVATWWCGQKEARRYVVENLDKLFVKPLFRSRRRVMSPERRLVDAEQEQLRRQIQFRPNLFVAQEWIDLSTAPCVTPEGLAPRRVSLRAFAVASNGSYKVMPGGLTRVAPSAASRSVAMQRGGGSKDTWILSDREVEDVSLLNESGRTIELRRVGNNLPSRMADNFFWMGRYAERVDATSRLLRSALVRFNPENTGGVLPVLAPVLSTLEAQAVLIAGEERPDLRQSPEALEAELLAAIFDPDRAGSLRALGEKLQRLAMLARERTSADLWRVLTQLHNWLTPAGTPVLLSGDAVEILNKVLMNVAALHGLARENMTRAQGWRFLDIGCRMERSLQLCGLLDAALQCEEAENPSLLEAVLDVCDSTITYRSRYNLLPNSAAVLDLVLLDDTNPRSLLFQLSQLVKHFERLPQEQRSALPTASQRILLEAITRLRLLDPREIASGPGAENPVHKVVRLTLRDLPRLSEEIAVSYFAHSAISRAGGSA
jgi:uncharacterized circularly permuted ATP-grasp superfamily protein/uncharacterized alpha-E superfamily protein